jgi:hypothetical protein
MKTTSERRRWLRFMALRTAGYAQSLIKSCVKILIGRPLYFNDRDLFFRQYLSQLILGQPIRDITCLGLHGEGAASQALLTMHAITFARASGLRYVHMPFRSIAHADRPMAEWSAGWEAMFNLGAGEAGFDGNRSKSVNFSYNFPELQLCFGWLTREDELRNHFIACLPDFRRKYYLNKTARKNDEIAVAVHVRRGDVGPDQSSLFTSTDIVVRTATQVKSILESRGLRYRLAVYSQGKTSEFQAFSELDAELFLNVDAIWTMQELIEADVLIMAKGTFSYYAGLISDGVKIAEPFHWPLENCLLSAPDGSFDREAFDRHILTEPPNAQ